MTDELRLDRFLRRYRRREKLLEFMKWFSVIVPAPVRTVEDRELAESLARKYLEQYGNAMLRLAYSYVHNYADAEEILQDAIMKVILVKPDLKEGPQEKAYLMTTVANLSKNKIQYNKLREADELSEELAAKEKTDLSFVWEAVKKLPENFRDVIHLFYQEGYATAEIAKILGRKEATVRSDLARARTMLKQVLREVYDFEEL